MPSLYSRFAKNEANGDSTLFIKAEKEYGHVVKQPYAFKPYMFDPNNISLDSLLHFGISPKLARSIIGYRTKVAPFAYKQQLLKVYGMDAENYAIIEAYIRLPEKPVKVAMNVDVVKIDINSADSVTLLAIKSVYPSMASRIIKYRNLLGWYHDVRQLKEVWGMDDKLFQKLEDRIIVDTSGFEKKDIVNADYREIYRFPYFKNYAKAITKYLKEHKDATLLSLLQANIIPKDVYQKTVKYYK